MVSIFACGASTYISVPAIGGVSFDNNYQKPKVQIVQPLLLFPQYLYSQVIEPGSIMTGSPNSFGEKSCKHHNVSGVIFDPGSISIDTPCPTYDYNVKYCISQHPDSSGTYRKYPYTTLATLSSVIEVRDDAVYERKIGSREWTRVYGQSITWKRYRNSVFASVNTRKVELFNPDFPDYGKIKSRYWNTAVYLYDYRDFPRHIYVATKILDGSDYANIPTFEAACKAADQSWWEWTDALNDGFILPCTNTTPYSVNSFTRAQYQLRSLCFDPDFDLRFKREPMFEWGDLCEEAINDCHVLDVNSLAFTKDLLCLVPELKGLATLLSSLKSVGRFASLYLSYRYGLPLTINDTKEVMKRVHDLKSKCNDLPVSIVRSQSKTGVRPCGGVLLSVQTKQWYKIYYRPIDTRIMNIMRSLLDWDIYPTFQNLWDLVPFSFVIDWFIDVESLMNKMDANVYLPYLEVLSVTRTRKDVCTVPASSLGVSGIGDLTITLYHRDVSSTLDTPRLKLDQPKKFRNWAELTAIILQKRR